MEIQRRGAQPGDLAFWLAVVSSTLVGLTFLMSEVVSLLGAPPQQAWFTLAVGIGIGTGLICAFAGVVAARAGRRQAGAGRKAKKALVVGYCILGSLAALAVLATLTLIGLAH